MSLLNRSVLVAYKSTARVCLSVPSRCHSRKANPAQHRFYKPKNRFVSDGQEQWRLEQGLPRNPNAYGPLTDKRDFSYLDGRPAPLGINQMKRTLKQKEYVEKILQHVKEMNYAVERHEMVKKQEEERKQAILSSKLKPKGHLLLQKTSD